MDIQAEKTNEFEMQFFGFSPVAFSDSVHNVFIEEWTKIVQELWKEPALAQVSDSKECRENITRNLFKGGHYAAAIKQLKETTLKYVFRIPEHVTLPAHRSQLEIPDDYDRDQLEEEIRQLEKEVVKKRVILRKQQIEERDIRDSMDVMMEMRRVTLKQRGIEESDETVSESRVTVDESSIVE